MAKTTARPERLGEVQISREGAVPAVELVIPYGTRMADIFKAQEAISRDIISKISPRGCQACTSGVHLTIRERFQEVIRVDLQTGKLQGTLAERG